MARANARLDKVIKGSLSLLDSLPGSYFSLPNRKIVNFYNFPKDPEVSKVKMLLHLKEERPLDEMSCYFSAKKLCDFLKNSVYLNDSKVKILYDELKVCLSNYEKNFYQEIEKKKPVNHLSEKSASELKNMIKHCGQDDEDIKNELESKEHVLSSAQSRLIRKMSIHAGKKLTLRDAQILDNSLRKKTKT
jgi:hypothetical protein